VSIDQLKRLRLDEFFIDRVATTVDAHWAAYSLLEELADRGLLRYPDEPTMAQTLAQLRELVEALPTGWLPAAISMRAADGTVATTTSNAHFVLRDDVLALLTPEPPEEPLRPGYWIVLHERIVTVLLPAEVGDQEPRIPDFGPLSWTWPGRVRRATPDEIVRAGGKP
jgi:hypothetical protein